MSAARFKAKDRVRINKKAPLWIRELVKYQRTRAVAGSFYSRSQERRLYQLQGDVPYSFRGNMLTLVTPDQQAKVGRPKTKRRYNRRDTTTPALSPT